MIEGSDEQGGRGSDERLARVWEGSGKAPAGRASPVLHEMAASGRPGTMENGRMEGSVRVGAASCRARSRLARLPVGGPGRSVAAWLAGDGFLGRIAALDRSSSQPGLGLVPPSTTTRLTHRPSSLFVRRPSGLRPRRALDRAPPPTPQQRVRRRPAQPPFCRQSLPRNTPSPRELALPASPTVRRPPAGAPCPLLLSLALPSPLRQPPMYT